MIPTNSSENTKRRSFSRASSVISTNRLTSNYLIDDMNTDTSGTNSLALINDRTRSLSNEHRYANPSLMSIASRTSIRYSTPRESTVFTKTEAPAVVRLLQQTHHQDPTDAIKTLIEYQRLQTSSMHQEHIQPAIIIEEDISPPLTISSTNNKSPTTNGVIKSNVENVSLENGHTSSNIKRKSTNENVKQKHRACCTIS